MEMCTEDEDSLEEQNFKCPYCSQEFVSRDNIIKHMENKHSIGIILYNFILSNTSINYMCSHLYELLKMRIKTLLPMVYFFIINIYIVAKAYYRSCRLFFLYGVLKMV